MSDIQRRAEALKIAALFIGPLPNGSDLESESSFKDYLSLAGKIEEYILRGGTILAPKQPDNTTKTLIGKYTV